MHDAKQRKRKTADAKKRDDVLKSWLDISALKAKDADLARLLFDQVTELPTVPLLFEEIRKILIERGQLGLLCVNIVKYSSIEEIYGWQTFDGIVREVAECLTAIKGSHLRREDVLTELMISGNAFVVLVSPPRKKQWLEFEDLDHIRDRIYEALNERLGESLEASLYRKFGCYIGRTIMDYEPSARLERLVYRALDDALYDSSLQEARDAEYRMENLKDIIRREAVHTVYQPIVEVRTAKVIGYEALSRGPEGEFEHPDKLFKVAYEADLVWRLERLCRDRAFEGARELLPDQNLFVNVDPDAIHDPQFRSPGTETMLEKYGLDPHRVVLELTERTAIRDFTMFRHTLDIFRGLGYRVAIDDVGAGYAGLQSIAEVKPDFIKVDMSLVRNINNDPVKRELVDTVVRFAKRAKIKLIAEGVEQLGELEVLDELGVKYAQGYLFARPGMPFPVPEIPGLNELRKQRRAGVASGKAAAGKAAAGKAAAGKAASGKAASGKAASGKAASGKAASGKAASGKAAT